MKAKDIAEKYDIDPTDFYDYLKDMKLDFTASLFSYTVDDDKVEEYVQMYEDCLDEIEAEEIAAAKAEEEAEKNARAEAQFKKKALEEMLITSGFTFDGYTITKYSGYISGDDATQIPRSGYFGKNDNGQNLTDALVKIRRQALKELKEAAYNLGCNAVIGVDFDYITLEPERNSSFSAQTVLEPYVICVTANGNAVVIEKNQTNITQAFNEQKNKNKKS